MLSGSLTLPSVTIWRMVMLEIYSYGDFPLLQGFRTSLGESGWFLEGFRSLLLSKFGQHFLLSVQQNKKNNKEMWFKYARKHFESLQYLLVKNIYKIIQYVQVKRLDFIRYSKYILLFSKNIKRRNPFDISFKWNEQK